MEWLLLLKAVLSLVLVLGLLLLTLWAIKYLEVNSSKLKFIKKLGEARRIEVVETKRLDAKNSIILIRRDNVEHLVLLGNSNLLIENNIIAPKNKNKSEK